MKTKIKFASESHSLAKSKKKIMSGNYPLYSFLNEEVLVKKNQFYVIPTGITLELPKSVNAEVVCASYFESSVQTAFNTQKLDFGFVGKIEIVFLNQTEKAIKLKPNTFLGVLRFEAPINLVKVRKINLPTTKIFLAAN